MSVNQETNFEAQTEAEDIAKGSLGMWLFLFTELMLFGVMFTTYSVYRASFPAEFHTAARQLNLAMGSFNTFVLLTSSLTMVISISALQRKDRDLSLCMLISTIVLGCLFLLNKGFEWMEKFNHGIFPGSEHLSSLPHGQQLYFDLYFLMTGIHGLHVIGGIAALAVMLFLVTRNFITPENCAVLDNTGLYWHLVDIIWIFLLPLFYVIS